MNVPVLGIFPVTVVKNPSKSILRGRGFLLLRVHHGGGVKQELVTLIGSKAGKQSGECRAPLASPLHAVQDPHLGNDASHSFGRSSLVDTGNPSQVPGAWVVSLTANFNSFSPHCLRRHVILPWWAVLPQLWQSRAPRECPVRYSATVRRTQHALMRADSECTDHCFHAHQLSLA